ncbi:cell division protein FtsQ/DivIB [Trueperella bialowiezensis]|uniref:cell division protein FtsQ/DivIB n=1 Tax=Trueperella bialowiezensis TaxID=312285 RepID=UPI0013DFBF01|nr:FtsQ-type POTRA domain-containing protein [Trueperella bialowiezensis]
MSERQGGGELPVANRPTIDDHVPTAPMPPPADAVDAEWTDAEDTYTQAGWSASSAMSNAEDDAGGGEHDSSESDIAEDSEPSTSLIRRELPAWLTPDQLRALPGRLGSTFTGLTSAVSARNTSDKQHDQHAGSSVSLDARREERRRENQLVTVKRLVKIAAVIIVCAIAAWALLGSPVLRYKYSPEQITGYGEPSIVNRGELEQLVATYDGKPLLLLNERAMEEDITSQIAEVAAVSVTRDFPRSLSISITEATPVACLAAADTCTAVTADGTELDIPQEIAGALPRIGSIGDQINRASAVSHAVEVLGALTPETRGLIADISVANGDLATLTLTDGRTVFWGGFERNAFKAQVLNAIISQPASHYDVSVPEAPVSR